MLNPLFNIELIHPKAKIPKRAHPCDAGLDIYAIDNGTVQLDTKGAVTSYRTGLKLELPAGHVGLIFPRSSITDNTSLMLGNAIAVIDENFRGEIILKYRDLSNGFGKNKYKEGERIAQLLLFPIQYFEPRVVEKLNETDRNENGLGSTGR